MDYREDQEVVAFRDEVKNFISDNLPDDWGKGSAGEGYDDYVFPVTRAFQSEMAKRRWLTLAWPKEHGGLDAPHSQQMVMAEEMAYHRAPGGGGNMGVQWVGPSLMLYGTDAQKDEHLKRIVDAESWWCTLYSEPGSGSDLASLQTRAVADGDDYVINGQKIWTSGAHVSDWGWLAARTDPDAPKHKGITMFMLRMDTPGITVRPLINMAEGHGFNEVFFEDVRIPKSNVVGETNRGWYHLAVALDFERSGIGAFAGGRRTVEEITDFRARQPSPARRAPGGALRARRARHRGRGRHLHGLPDRLHAGARRGGEPRGIDVEAVRLGAGPADREDRHGPARSARQRLERRPLRSAAGSPQPQLCERRFGHDRCRYERDPAQHHRDARARPAARVTIG